MSKKFLCVFFLILSSLALSAEVFAQRINKYQSRVSIRQNYSYYRYQRRVVSFSASRPLTRPGYASARPIYRPVAYQNPAYHVQNFSQPSQQIYEEEIREEFRTWPSRLDADGSESAALEVLEREVAELRNEVKELSRKIDLYLSSAQKQQESDIRSGDAEKMERLKQELRELKALLEQLKREK